MANPDTPTNPTTHVPSSLPWQIPDILQPQLCQEWEGGGDGGQRRKLAEQVAHREFQVIPNAVATAAPSPELSNAG